MEHTLTRKQFDILTCLEAGGRAMTQRELSAGTGMSVGSVNRMLAQLTEKGLAAEGQITQAGLTALEPYRVKRAIFIAAGFGSRLVPITLNTPKPLVRVKGKRMIDTMLDAVLAAGIQEIYVVRGYLGEQFDQLLYKYPMIHLIDNPLYNEANNICSAMQVRHLLRSAYMLDADLVVSNPAIIQKYQYTSNYLGVPVETTDDWCLQTKNHYITGMYQGGTDCYHMLGVSYWSQEDGARLEEDIPAVCNMPGGKERYWDQVPLEFFRNHYKVEVRTCSFQDIVEIDSFSDLKAIDSVYDQP